MTTNSEDKVVQVLTYGWCARCNKNPAEPDHTCPYAADINDDYESLCNCCPECASECADDI